MTCITSEEAEREEIQGHARSALNYTWIINDLSRYQPNQQWEVPASAPAQP